MIMNFSRQKTAGLYNPQNEHDSCGVGFIASIKGEKTHQIVLDGLKILENLEHRGAVGADPLMGDGAGIMLQIPDKFFREKLLARWGYSSRRGRVRYWYGFFA